jgi:hypothetical protein
MSGAASGPIPPAPTSSGANRGAFRENGREPPRCKCGHDRNHPMVSPQADYSFFGWAFILVGVSWEPKSIEFVCRTCGESVERLVDPKLMKSVRLAG